MIDDAKKKHRSQPLSKWSQSRFCNYPDSTLIPDPDAACIPRVHCRSLPVKEFIDKYETPSLPVLIDGIPETESWPAMDNWDLKTLSQRYSNRRMKCGADDDGYSVKIKLKHFMKYMESQKTCLQAFPSLFKAEPSPKKKQRSSLDGLS